MRLLKRVLPVVVVVVAVAAPSYAEVRRVRETYGGLCNGSSNDTAAIVNAIAAANPGDWVEFPAGVCTYDWNIEITGKSNLRFYGAGIDATTLMAADPHHSAFMVRGSSYITVENLTVASVGGYDPTRPSEAAGFWVYQSSHITFNAVKVRDVMQVGISFLSCEWSGVYGSRVERTGADGVHVAGAPGSGPSRHIVLQNNYAWGNGDDSFATVGYGGIQNEDITFSGNTSEYSATSGVTVEGAVGVVITGNVVRSSGQDITRHSGGIRVCSTAAWPTSGSHDVDISSNVIESVWINYGYGSTLREDAAIIVSTNYQGIYNVWIHENRIYSPNLAENAVIQLIGTWWGYPNIWDCAVWNNYLYEEFETGNQVVWYGPYVFDLAVGDNLRNGELMPMREYWPSSRR